MDSKALFYLTLLILASTAASTNGTEAKEAPLPGSHANFTTTQSIEAQVPSNNKPLLIKGPTLDTYDQSKSLNASLKHEQIVVMQPEAKTQEEGKSVTSTNIKTTEQAPSQPSKTPTTHQSTPNKTDASIKTADQQPKKESVAKEPSENSSKPLPTPEEQKKKEEKLKTQAIEEKMQRDNLPKLKQSQIRVIAASKQVKPLQKEKAEDKRVAVTEQVAQKDGMVKQEQVKPQNTIVEVIFPHPDEQKPKIQTPQAKETTISKESADKQVKNDSQVIQTLIKSNVSNTQKVLTQQIKIIPLEEETIESEQPSQRKAPDAEKGTPSKIQQDTTKKTVLKQDGENKEQDKQTQAAIKIGEKAADKEGINNSSQKNTPAVKQTSIVSQAIDKEESIDKKQTKAQEFSQEQEAMPSKDAVANNQSKLLMPQAQQKAIKHTEPNQKQATKEQTPIKASQLQLKGETSHVTQKAQAIKTPQAKQEEKPQLPDTKDEMPVEPAKKGQKQPGLKQLLQEVKLDMNEKAKMNVIKHLQDQIKQLQQQTKQPHENPKKEVSAPHKPQNPAKQQHLKQQQPITLQIGEQESSQEIMDTPTIMVIIVMTFIISIPIFREIKNKQNAPPQASRKQPNDPASATQDANQRLDLQFTDLDNQTGCAIGQPIDQQQR